MKNLTLIADPVFWDYAAMQAIAVRLLATLCPLFCVSTVSSVAQDAPPAPSVQKAAFGKTKAGEAVELYTLKNSRGTTARVMTYGAIIYSLDVADRHGKFENVTANRDTVNDYEERSPGFGALIGRYANRIAKGKFVLDGKEITLPLNGGPNHIHGGNRGFAKRVWKAEPISRPDTVGVKLTYVSADGEEGYPGTLTATVLYELSNQDDWTMDYTATTDKPTVVNLCNHAYWNLAGAYSGNVLDQLLTLNADKFLPTDATLIPTGEMASVEGTPLDFRTPHKIGERIGQIQEKHFNGGYDHCLVVNHQSPGDLAFCGRLEDPKSGRVMEVFTTEPGVQIYTANFDPGGLTGPKNYAYPRNLGVCLETQHFPDSPNKPQFPSTALRPGEVYRAKTVHRFRVAQ